MNKISERILKQLESKDIIQRLLALKTGDFNSLLLHIFRDKVAQVTPQAVLKAYEQNRFTKQSMIDPIAFHEIEIKLLKLAAAQKVQNILVSPVAPLASCSAFGCVDQNNVMSALRGSEVLSDPSNMLAILLADGLKQKVLDNKEAIHYATTARVVRTQAFEGKGFLAHFGLYCMVSTAKATSSYGCETELFVKHLTYYKVLFSTLEDAKLSIVLRKRKGYKDGEGFFDTMGETLQALFPEIAISYLVEDEDNAYYKGINFKLYLQHQDEQIEVADGGFVDWIEQMTGNAKNRCFISGMGIERLMMLE